MNLSIKSPPEPPLLTSSPYSKTESEDVSVVRGHGLEPMPFCTLENIKLRAETVTPTLQRILDHWPVEHWDQSW